MYLAVAARETTLFVMLTPVGAAVRLADTLEASALLAEDDPTGTVPVAMSVKQ